MTFSLTILGSSSALPTSQRFPTAHVLNVHERLFLIDCAEGTQIQLRRFKIKLSRIEAIFISHLHGDHVLGLVGLLSTLNLLNRKNELSIYAHAPLESILNQNINFFINDLNYPIRFRALDARKQKVIYQDKDIIVESIPLKHRINSNGFIFREVMKLPNINKDLVERYSIPLTEILKIKQGGDYKTTEGKIIPNHELTYFSSLPRSYAYCSDTRFFEKLAQVVHGVDLLYHESTFGSDMKKMAKATYHSTAKQAATIAKMAGVKKLIIGHFSSRYKDINPLIEEARSVFPESYPANDGNIFEVPVKKEF